MPNPAGPAPKPEAESRGVRHQTEDALRGLRFGQVTLIMQDGMVIQIERTDRRRFKRPSKLK
jgi:hypothetical protein